MSILLEHDDFCWLIQKGELDAEDKKFIRHLTPISEPQTRLHGIKAIKILEYFAKNFDSVPVGAQIAAIQGFIETFREKKGDKKFNNGRSTEGNEYFEYLKRKVLQYEPPGLSDGRIPITKISMEELRSKTGEDAYQCVICRLPFITKEQYEMPPPADQDPTSTPLSLEEFQQVNALVVQALAAASPNDSPDEVDVLHQLSAFATNLARLCVSPMVQLGKTEAGNPVYTTEDGPPKAVDFAALLEQIASYRCEEPIRTECGHVFGTSCLQQWINEQGDHAECPYCRKRLSRKPATADFNFYVPPWFHLLNMGPTPIQQLAQVQAAAHQAQAAAQNAEMLEQIEHVVAQTAGTEFAEGAAQWAVAHTPVPYQPSQIHPSLAHPPTTFMGEEHEEYFYMLMGM